MVELFQNLSRCAKKQFAQFFDYKNFYNNLNKSEFVRHSVYYKSDLNPFVILVFSTRYFTNCLYNFSSKH